MSAESTRIDIFLRSNEALVRHMDERSIAIAAFKNDVLVDICSGTGIKIDERYFVATAAHMVRDYDLNDLKFVCSKVPTTEQISPSAMGFRGGGDNDTLDIAWLELTADDARRTGKVFIGIDRLRTGVFHLESDLVLLSGFPSDLIKKELLEYKLLRVQAYGYYTNTLPPSEWPDRGNAALNIFLDYPNVGNVTHRGTTITLPPPYGVSGGGIWAARINESGLCSPDKAVMIGIECAWYPNRRIATGIQIKHWIEIISIDIPSLQVTLAPILA